MRLAKRLSVIEPSMTLKVSAKAAELKAKGVDVVSFGAGRARLRHARPHQGSRPRRRWTPGPPSTPTSSGTPQLRKAVAAWFSKAHGFDVAPNEVMVAAGAKQVIFNAFHAVLDEGDEVILPAPYWVSYSEIAKLAGAKPVPVVSRAEDEFVVNPDAVARAITPRTRMLAGRLALQPHRGGLRREDPAGAGRPGGQARPVAADRRHLPHR